ncbi:MAG: hypothetical protein WB554_02770 [Desulfomonilaceae bacterium]
MKIPGIVTFCIQKGFSLITCSDVFPDTIGKLLEIKNMADPISSIQELNDFVTNSPKDDIG